MTIFLDAFSSNKDLFCWQRISLAFVNVSFSRKWSWVIFLEWGNSPTVSVKKFDLL